MFKSAAICLPMILATLPACAGSFAPLGAFGDNPGALSADLFRPETARNAAPLILALHGCGQTGRDFAVQTGLTDLADDHAALLLVPQQSASNDMAQCFRWYDGDDTQPGRGETASLSAMIAHVIATEPVDPAQVYVVGLSAGGAMATALLATHPETFAGGAIFAGLPYGCNRPAGFADATWHALSLTPGIGKSLAASKACGITLPGMANASTDRAPSDWAGYITDTMSDAPDTWPRLSLWQGAADPVVDPRNLQELTEQWTAVQGFDQTPDTTEIIGTATRAVYTDAKGAARLETWSLPSLAHAVPISGADTDPACGHPAPFVETTDLCAVRHVAAFWGLK